MDGKLVGVLMLAAAVMIALIMFVGCLDRALHSAGKFPPIQNGEKCSND